MSELKDYKVYTTRSEGAWGYHYEPNPNKDQSDIELNGEQVYLKKDADKVIAGKDAEIRRLNHKYWNDRADEAAKMKRLIQDGQVIYLDEYCNEKDWRIMHKVWKDEEDKCRAKAEEYK